MGGEQYPVLVYGPKKSMTIQEWLLVLSVVDVKQFADSVRDEDESEERYSDESLFIDCYEENEEDNNKLVKLLEDNKLEMVYFNYFGWEQFSIGYEVKEYDKVSSEEKEKVKTFCEKYNLGEPTFYAGICGEEE